MFHFWCLLCASRSNTNYWFLARLVRSNKFTSKSWNVVCYVISDTFLEGKMLIFSKSPDYLFQEELLLRLTFLAASIEKACKVCHWDSWEPIFSGWGTFRGRRALHLGHLIFLVYILPNWIQFIVIRFLLSTRERERFLKHHWFLCVSQVEWLA